MNLVFEKIGAAKVNKDLQCLKIQIDAKIYLIGLQDLEQAIKDNIVIGVFRIPETTQQESAKKAEKNESER